MLQPHRLAALAALVILAFSFRVLAFAADTEPEKDNAELARLYAEDQADRQPPAGKQIDWEVVSARDDARLARIKELYATSQLKTGPDFYHAAMVLQHGDGPDDFLLAHELCVIAISKGYNRALWLAAASEDRFLRSIGRPQRFATQYRSESGGPHYLQETDASVTDDHRRLMKAQPLAEAKARAARFDGRAKISLAPKENAPALTQDIFAATDDANTALEKLRPFKVETADDALRLQQACRDLCVRYTAPFPRSMAMMRALDHWRKLTPEHIAQLGGWDPAQGEDDPELDPALRVNLGQRLAYLRAARRTQAEGLLFEDAVMHEMAALVRKHPSVRNAHDALVGAALNVAPEKAIPVLRENLPDIPSAVNAIHQLERIGHPCEIQLTTLDGRAVNTSELRGKVVVVHFFTQRFATAVPKLKELLARHGDRLAVIGVCSDKTRAEVDTLVADQAITWPVHHQPTGHSGKISTQFRATTLPYYLLIDRAGNLRFRGISLMEVTALAKIDALLKEPAP